MYPKISVIMPVYNESISELSDSISSILNQTYKKFEFIIVDDNPFNNRIRTYIRKCALQDNRIKLIFNKYKNIGAVQSSNEGIKISRGLFVDRMDADDVASKDKLKTQLEFIVNNNLDLVCSNFSVINDVNRVTRKYGYHSDSVLNQKKIKNILSHCNIAMGPTLFFRKSVFTKLGGYRNINVEDYDLVARFLVERYRVGYQNKPLIYKRLRKNSISYKTIFSQYIIMKSISTFLYKTHFREIIPLNLIKNNLNKVTLKEVHNFNRFSDARYSLNDNVNIKNVWKLFISIISSVTVIKWCFWDIRNKYYQ